MTAERQTSPAREDQIPAPEIPSSDTRRRLELHLALKWRLNPRDLRRVRAAVLSGRLPFPCSENDLTGNLANIPAGLRGELLAPPDRNAIEQTEATMQRLRIRFLTCDDQAFPHSLREIPDEPPYLFVRGEGLAEPGDHRVAIVGSRAASQNGLELAYTLGRDLALAGCVVVSGLARGIDASAHRGALEAGGRSIAVLGTGCDICYPPEHAGLFGRILRQGGIMSEFPPGTPGLRLHFPRRNRVLSGISLAVVVVEGTARSGARSTVDHSLDQGREVLAVPRDPLHPGAALPNSLIRDGARPVLAVGDILKAIEEIASSQQSVLKEKTATGRAASGNAAADRHACTSSAATVEQRVLACLRDRPAELDSVLECIPQSDVGLAQAALLRLELQGRVRRLPGGRYEVV